MILNKIKKDYCSVIFLKFLIPDRWLHYLSTVTSALVNGKFTTEKIFNKTQ